MRRAGGCSIILFGAIWLSQEYVLPQEHEAAALPAPQDLDQDGIPDGLEQELAERHAPLLLMDPNEPNLPMDVHRFLASTELWSYEESCAPARTLISAAFRELRTTNRFESCNGLSMTSHGTRSFGKRRTFYLRPVNVAIRKGSASPLEWATYFHAYRNESRGITVQYWRFYAYNTGYWRGMEIPAASHEGDWEAIHVVLGPPPSFNPVLIRLLGHQKIESHAWRDVIATGGHAVIGVEKGGHTSVLANRADLARLSAFLQHESWTGGRVCWPSKNRNAGGDTVSSGGPLRNLGEKTSPMKGMEFLLYTGLWGSREAGLFGYYRSGYWGPAMNETSMRRDGFIAAWCEGMAEPAKEIGYRDIGLVKECFPTQAVP